MNETPLILFLLEPDEYALSAMEVREVVLLPELVPIAGATPLVAGVFNLRGEVVTVIDLRRRLRLSERPWNERNAVLVVSRQGRPFGLLVDEALSLVTLKQEEIESPPDITGESETPLLGFGKMNGKVIQILDSGKILASAAGVPERADLR